MIKLAVLGLAILSQACSLPTGGKQSDSQSEPQSHKCVEIKDQDDCKANPNCKINIWTKKCVDALWEKAVKAEECKEIKGNDCGAGSAIPISKAIDNDSSKLEVIGLCGTNDSGYWCQKAPIADPSHNIGKQCVLTDDKDTWQKAAAEICEMFEESGGEKKRITLPGTISYWGSCQFIALNSPKSHHSLTGFCKKQSGTKLCEFNERGTDTTKNLKLFCLEFSQKRYVTDSLFTQISLEEFVDEDACNNAAFVTAEKDINGFDPVAGTVKHVCVVKTK